MKMMLHQDNISRIDVSNA